MIKKVQTETATTKGTGNSSGTHLLCLQRPVIVISQIPKLPSPCRRRFLMPYPPTQRQGGVSKPKNQLVEKLRRLKKKYRNVMSKIGLGREVVFKGPHDQATFDIARKIWNQTGKIIGFEDINVIDFEETNNHHHHHVEIDSDNNVLEKKGEVSRKRSRSRIGKVDEDSKPISLSDGPMASGATNNENVAEFSGGRSLGGLIEETVKSCVSPMIKEMMNGTMGMMMGAVGGYPGGGGVHAMGLLSSMLMPSVNLGFSGGGVGDERWRSQQILELEVYSWRLELVQEQIRATLHELKTMPSGG